MKLKMLLIIAAIYMALIGLGHLISPVAMSAGVVPADASVGLIVFLRHYAALFIAIAIMNWMARNEAVSPARNAIVTANIVLFGLGAVLDVLGVFSGAGIIGLVPGTINLIFAVAFFWIRRTSMSARVN